jgi:type I restriction enzyme S subunit
MYKSIKISDFLHRVKVPVEIEPDQEYSLVTIKVHHKGVVLRNKTKGSLIGSKMYKISTGQFILSGIDARHGAFGIVPDELDGAIVTNDFWYFDIDETKVKRDFFYWLTNTPLFLNACIKSSQGVTQRIRLQAKLFFDFEFRFPPLEEQENFLKKIQHADQYLTLLRIELNKQEKYVSQLKQAVLQEAIAGQLTTEWHTKNPMEKGNPDTDAAALLTKIKAEKQRLIADGKLKKEKPLAEIAIDEIPFSIPDSWVWCRLGALCSIVRGGSPRPAGDKKYYEGDIPFLKVADLTRFETIFLNDYTYTIKEAGLYKTRFVEANTLMLTNSGATLGVPKICTFPTTFNDGIAAFLGLLDEFDKVFLYYFLKSKTKWFLSEAARGQGQPNLNTDIIGNTLIAIPPLAEQKAIVEKCDRLMNIIDQLEQQIKHRKQLAEDLMQTVLREAFE